MESQSLQFEQERAEMRQKLDKSLNLLTNLKQSQDMIQKDKEIQAEELVAVRQQLLKAKQSESELQKKLDSEKSKFEKRIREASQESAQRESELIQKLK